MPQLHNHQFATSEFTHFYIFTSFPHFSCLKPLMLCCCESGSVYWWKNLESESQYLLFPWSVLQKSTNHHLLYAAAQQPTEDKLIVLQSSWVWIYAATEWEAECRLNQHEAKLSWKGHKNRLMAGKSAWILSLQGRTKMKSPFPSASHRITFWLVFWQMWHFSNQFQAGVPMFIWRLGTPVPIHSIDGGTREDSNLLLWHPSDSSL